MTDEQLRDLAKDLPYERPSAARRDALRSSLLVEAAESTEPRVGAAPRRWPMVAAFTAGALAAAAIAIIVIRPSTTSIERTNLAQVTASSPEVRIDHQIVATETGSDEIVKLRDGTIALAIPAQRRGDRVRIQTATAEVEGDAGELEVTVAHEQLQTVKVKAGVAKVIVVGQAPVILAAGQTWRASVITAELSSPGLTSSPAADENRDPVASTTIEKLAPIVTKPDPAPAPAAVAAKADPALPPAAKLPTVVSKTELPVAPASKPPAVAEPGPAPVATPKPAAVVEPPPAPAIVERVTPPAPSPKPATIEQRFKRGWDLLRAGKAQQAADELGAAADAAPESPLAADARYFQAVALVRANDPRAAERVLVQFLDGAPKSLRRGRAAVLLGRLLAERGDTRSARAWLDTAANDPDPAIAAAAKAGLQSLKD